MMRSHVEFANPSLAMPGLPHGVYPDDFDLQAPNPNTHISAVRIPVYLEAHDHKKILPTLQQNGVQFSNLTAQLPGLQRVLQRLADATARTGSERLDDEHVAAVRQVFEWSLLQLTDHSSLTILHAEPAGIITRSTGPGVQFHEGSGGAHRTSRGQFWKPMIHGDQDVHGSPIRELLWGLAPLLFARASPLKLLNVWMPVQRVRVQPLVVMDLASLNESDRLHYHIHSSDRLGARLNDCWTFTHRPEQRWLTHALPWEAGQAALFNTLYTPHSSAPYPGEEDSAAVLWRQLRESADCLESILERAHTQAAAAAAAAGHAPEEACSCVNGEEAGHGANNEGGAAASEVASPVREALDDMRASRRLLQRECASLPPAELHSHALHALRRSSRVSLEVRVVALRWTWPGLVTSLLAAVVQLAVSWHVCQRRRRRFAEVGKCLTAAPAVEREKSA